MSRRVAATLTLAVLAPVTAEFLLGDQYIPGPPSLAQLGMLVLYVAFYGFGAVGIREIARRCGGGWPAILTMAVAFALVEEGLLTQSLFNPNYLDQHLGEQGQIPVLGIPAPWAVYVLTLHAVWSFGAPIAIAERLFGREPWLGRAGRWVTGVLYVLGALATLATSLLIGRSMPGGLYVSSPVQLVGAAVVAAALVTFAVRRSRTPQWTEGSQLLGVLLGVIASSGFQLARNAVGVDPWFGTALMLGIVVVAVLLVRWLRPGYFGLGAGATITYWWLGMLQAVPSGTAAVIEQSLLIVASAVVLIVAARRPVTSPARIDVLAAPA